MPRIAAGLQDLEGWKFRHFPQRFLKLLHLTFYLMSPQRFLKLLHFTFYLMSPQRFSKLLHFTFYLLSPQRFSKLLHFTFYLMSPQWFSKLLHFTFYLMSHHNASSKWSRSLQATGPIWLARLKWREFRMNFASYFTGVAFSDLLRPVFFPQ